MIVAALDTGRRRGELLALRFDDVDWKRRLIVLRGATTKSRRTRASRSEPRGCSKRGVPLAQVRDLLGHVSILTTERYDNQKLEALQPRSNGWNEARRLSLVRLKPDTTGTQPPDATRALSNQDPRTTFQESFKIPRKFPRNSPSPTTLSPSQESPQAIERLLFGILVAVPGSVERCNLPFSGTAS